MVACSFYKTFVNKALISTQTNKITKNRKYNIYTLYMKNINDDSLWKHST